MGSLSEPLSDLPGGYRLLRHLGRGAYGEVWHAEAPGGVEVAIKIIPRTLPSGQPETELQALHLIKGLRHQNLLSLQAFFPLPDRLVIVLELADGCLRRRMHQRRDEGLEGIPSAELLVYAREAAEALDFLHSRELLHRDIKPDNLLLLGSHVKVADYGLARVMDKSSLQTATTVGTPSYMAPEVFQGKVSPHSDQYSLAITYAELRLGRPPHLAENLGQMMYQHLFAEPDLGPLPAAERQVLLRALAKDPLRRFPSCTAMVQALMEAIPVTLPKGSGVLVTASASPTAKAAAGPSGTDVPLASAHTLVPRQGLIHTTVDRAPSASGAQWRRGHGPGHRRWLLPTVLAGLAGAAGLGVWASGVFQQPDDPLAAVSETIRPSLPATQLVAESGTAKAGVKKIQPPTQAAPPARQTAAETPRLRVSTPRQTVMGRGQVRYFAVRFERRMVTGPIALDVDNLPEGIKVSGIRPIRIPAGRESGWLVLSPTQDAAPGDYELAVSATAAGVRADCLLRLTVVLARFPKEQFAEDDAAVGLAPWDPLAYLNRALAYRRVGDFTKAFADYGEALRLDPISALAYHSRGNAHAQHKAYDKALADLTEAIRLDPAGYPAMYRDRGNVFRLKRDFERALADYGEALRLDPRSASAHYGRGMTYENMLDHDRALADFDEAIRLDPRDSITFGQRAQTHLRRKDVDSALADFSEAIRLNPKYAWAMNHRGTLYGQKGDWKKAVADFEQAMKVAPKFALPYRNRGNYYRLQKDYDRAIADLTVAIRLSPQYANAYQLRGLAYRAKGDVQRADADLQKARQLEAPSK